MGGSGGSSGGKGSFMDAFGGKSGGSPMGGSGGSGGSGPSSGEQDLMIDGKCFCILFKIQISLFIMSIMIILEQ